MDLGMSFDGLGLVGSSEGGFSSYSDMEAGEKEGGSGSVKQSRTFLTEEDWRNVYGCLKLAKWDDYSVSRTMQLQSRSTLLRSNLEDDGLFNIDGLENSFHAFSTLTSYQMDPSVYPISSGLGSGSLNSNMHESLTGSRGPFRQSQWLEFENQSLIFKYITANVPVPANLIMPIRESLNPSGYSDVSTGSLPSNSVGGGSYRFGFSGRNDPEPGRCRRTDGKKWRCSRDVIADQKYCERHLNRVRRRSRKHVEGQTGHAAAKKLSPLSPSSASASGSGTTINSHETAHQIKSSEPAPDHSATDSNRFSNNKQNVEGGKQDSKSLSMLPKDPQTPVPKPHHSFEEYPRTDFESLLSSPHRNSTYQTKNFSDSSDFNAKESQDQSLRHSMDDWSKNESEITTPSWPEVQVQADKTQLSISIPIAYVDLSSSSSPQEKLTLSLLKLSRDLNPIRTSLGVGEMNEGTQKQDSWTPISWERSMGGPLGEALNSTNTPKDCNNNDSSSLDPMTEGWDSTPCLESSPTDVLQKTTFGSHSNSSTGSSPRAESNKTQENNSLSDDPVGSTLEKSTSNPSI